MDIINLLLVFLEGILSLFSPCVLPMIPIYLGILSNSSSDSLKEGKVKFINSPLFKNTVLFVLGISTTFFLLGSSASLLNHFFTSYKKIILIAGGIFIIIMGIFYMGYINIPFLQKEKRLNVELKEIKPLTAYIFGFAFSFGWTPCIGPMLSSILIMASASKSIFSGNILILIYTIGFTIPFVIIAMFYSKLYKYLDKLKLHLNLIKKIGGAILIISGLVLMLGGTDQTLTYLKKALTSPIVTTQNNESTTKSDKIKAPDFTLTDQYGKTHKLSDYKGKVVFLNFWATWCPPCRGEMPHIQAIYKEYSKDDVIILGIAAPNLGKEGSQQDIKNFLDDNGYTFPVVFDNSGAVMEMYSINAFPTTFIIDKDGYVNKAIPGAMEKASMESLINNVK
jgi:cytochrome c-type biogenesis protein